MRILILIPQFIKYCRIMYEKYCRIMYDYIFQKDRSVFIPIGIKRIRQYSVQLYCRILRTRQSACFIWYSRYPYDNSPKRCVFSFGGLFRRSEALQLPMDNGLALTNRNWSRCREATPAAIPRTGHQTKTHRVSGVLFRLVACFSLPPREREQQ